MSISDYYDDTDDPEILRAQKARLIQEVSSLKQQVSDELSLGPQLVQLGKDYSKLKRENMQKDAQIEELITRLSIVQENQKQHQKEAESTINSIRQSQSNELTSIRANYESECTKRDIQISSLQKSKQMLQSELSSTKSEIMELRRQNSDLLSAALHRFDEDFHSVSDLTNYLLSRPSEESTYQEEINPYQIKYDKLRSKYKSALNRCVQIEREADQLRQDLQSQEILKSQISSEYETHLQDLNNKLIRLEIDHKNWELEQKKKEDEPKLIRTRSEYTQTIPIKAAPKVEYIEKESSNSDLINQNKDLMAALDESLAENHNLKKKCRALKRSQRSIQSELNDARRQLSLRECVTKPPVETVERVIEKEVEITEKVDFLEKLNKENCEEIDILVTQKNKLEEVVWKLLSALKNMEEKIRLNDQQKLPKEKKEKVIVEKINWHFSDLPNELQQILQDITINPSEPSQSQANHIMQVTGKWIQNQLAAKEKEISKLNDLSKQADEELHRIQNQIQDAFGDLINSDDVSDIIASIRSEYDSTKNQLDDLSHEMKAAQEETNIPISEIPDQISHYQEVIAELEKKARTETKKRKKLELTMREALDDVQQQITCQTKELEALQKVSKETTETHEAEIANLQNQNKSLLEQIESERRQFKEKIEELDSSHEKEIEQLKSVTFPNDQSEKDDRIFVLEAKIELLEKQAKEWEKAASDASLENEKVSSQLRKERSSSERQISELESRLSNEEKQHALFVDELTKKLKESDNNRQKVESELIEKEEQWSNDRQSFSRALTQMKRLQEKRELEFRVEKEGWERQKRLDEAKSKALIIRAEVEARAEADEARKELIDEERRLLKFFAKQFPSAVDTKRPLDRECIESALVQVKSEMEAMKASMKSVRQLIHADDEQTIEDAMTAFILENHPQLRSV